MHVIQKARHLLPAFGAIEVLNLAAIALQLVVVIIV